MRIIQPGDYSAALKPLLSTGRIAPLIMGPPETLRESALSSLTIEGAFGVHDVKDTSMALACLCGLWLYYDFPEPAHRLSQTISNVTGYYWHAILHRRQPDYKNSKYWFRRTGEHPIFPRVATEAARLTEAFPTDPETEFLHHSDKWEADAFVDLCEACVQGQSKYENLCLQIQQIEWELLFDYCFRSAHESPVQES